MEGVSEALGAHFENPKNISTSSLQRLAPFFISSKSAKSSSDQVSSSDKSDNAAKIPASGLFNSWAIELETIPNSSTPPLRELFRTFFCSGPSEV